MIGVEWMKLELENRHITFLLLSLRYWRLDVCVSFQNIHLKPNKILRILKKPYRIAVFVDTNPKIINSIEEDTFKLIVRHDVKKFPTFWEIRRCVIGFTTARHLSLSRASWIQPTASHPFYLLLLSCTSAYQLFQAAIGFLRYLVQFARSN